MPSRRQSPARTPRRGTNASKRSSRLPRLLRGEPLESRTLLSSVGLGAGQNAPGVYAKAIAGPTVAKAASLVTAGNVTAKSANLSVLGSDAAGASTLTYTWKVSSAPSGGTATFSVNGTNAAQNDTVTFSEVGSYGVVVTITDASGHSVTSSLQITVAAKFTSIGVYPLGGKVAVGSNTLKVTGTSESLTAVALDQFGNPLSGQPSFSWSATTEPSGAAPTTVASNGNVTINFNKAGTYTETASATVNGVRLSTATSISVVAVPSTFTVTLAGSSTVTGTSAKYTVSQFYDQFHNLISSTTTLKWSVTSLPSGASAPTFSTSGQTTTVTFSSAGKYVFSVIESDQAGDAVTELVSVAVAQTLTSIKVTPGTASVAAKGTQQFQATAYDQFQHAMTAPSAYTWSASGGSVTTSGLFTAQSSAATDTITAKTSGLSATATVTVTAPAPGPSPSPSPSPTPSPGPSYQDQTLGSLIASLDAGGTITRNDMLQILDAVDAKGTLSAADFADLKTLVANASYYDMPDYIRVLATDVVDGNTANATYQGATLGNLAAGSTAAKLGDLIGKWFLGTDLPTLTSTSFSYMQASGSLFPQTPLHNDEYQGELGDCYFISSLGMIADSNPQAIENMFVNNGDGTYTVRFYTSAGVADYVTVNSQLVVYAGSTTLAYADFYESATSSSLSLWIPLAEKAYAQWNQTGNEGRDGTNTYNSIQGGWMDVVCQQVLGYNAADYNLTASTQQTMINALAAHEAVTIGTDSSSNSSDTLAYGLYGDHAYGVIGYNASTGTFTLYNPWGMDQPQQVTWADLEATTDGFVVANTSGSVPIPGASSVHVSMAAAAGSSAASAAGAVASSCPAAANDGSCATDSSGGATAATGFSTGGESGAADEQDLPALYSGGSTQDQSTDPLSSGLSTDAVDAVFASQDFGTLVAA
jgi:hypothetical protein